MFGVMKALIRNKYTGTIYPEHPRAVDTDRDRIAPGGRIGGYPGGGGPTGITFQRGVRPSHDAGGPGDGLGTATARSGALVGQLAKVRADCQSARAAVGNRRAGCHPAPRRRSLLADSRQKAPVRAAVFLDNLKPPCAPAASGRLRAYRRTGSSGRCARRARAAISCRPRWRKGRVRRGSSV